MWICLDRLYCVWVGASWEDWADKGCYFPMLSHFLVSPLAWIMKGIHLVYLSIQYLLLVRCIWELFIITVFQAQHLPLWYSSSMLMFDEHHNKGLGQGDLPVPQLFNSLSVEVCTQLISQCTLYSIHVHSIQLWYTGPRVWGSMSTVISVKYILKIHILIGTHNLHLYPMSRNVHLSVCSTLQSWLFNTWRVKMYSDC